MEPYLFEGVVLPERAQLSLKVALRFSHLTSGVTANASVSIVLNQIAVWIDTEVEWDIFDLRNVVKTMLQNELAVLGYLMGYAYDFELRRVINRSRGVDYVFGIDVPCIAERAAAADLDSRIAAIRKKTCGNEGLFIHRCFNDLVSAMKHADDSGFYCYRAIESLRQHCATKNGIAAERKADQWIKLREVAQCDEQKIRTIKDAADPLRHGDVLHMAVVDRAKLLSDTWDVVDGYLKNA